LPRPRSSVDIHLAGGYRIDQLDRLLRDLAPALSMREPRLVNIDMAGLAPVSPTAIAVITATTMRLMEGDLLLAGSTIVEPRSVSVRNYLMRMDFFRLLTGDGGRDEPFERRRAVGFRPCREFVTPDECRSVSLELTNALTEACATDKTARASIRICLDELAENVIHHADTPLGGFAAAQGWRKTSTFEIGMVDLGVGIRGSLTKNPAYADIGDDVTAITTALEPRVSATPERNSGIGLFITRLLLRENGGTLVVRSGRGALYAGASEDAYATEVAFPGTVVALRARTDRPLDIGDVYRRLNDDDDREGNDRDSSR
jgi:hypothetical protein